MYGRTYCTRVLALIGLRTLPRSRGSAGANRTRFRFKHTVVGRDDSTRRQERRRSQVSESGLTGRVDKSAAAAAIPGENGGYKAGMTIVPRCGAA